MLFLDSENMVKRAADKYALAGKGLGESSVQSRPRAVLNHDEYGGSPPTHRHSCTRQFHTLDRIATEAAPASIVNSRRTHST